ncbi:MAG: DoxX family protein [Planctomycetales bacterium]
MSSRSSSPDRPVAVSVRRLPYIACILLVVVRLAIGWQLLYEGLWKINSLPTAKPWTAEGYLKNSAGPFRDTFRGMLDDPDDLEKLDYAKVTAKWDRWVDLFIRTYPDLDEDAKKRLGTIVAKKKVELEADLVKNATWVGDPSKKIVGEIEIYKAMLKKYEERLKDAKLEYQREHLEKTWADIQAKRKMLVEPAEKMTKEIEAQAQKLLTVDQLRRGKLPQLPKKVDEIDQRSMWGLTVVGALLILGLFTRLASLAGAALITLFYLAMPPWPGVPDPPGPEHSFIVNKNLIEVLMLLAFACMPTGRWLGLDAWIRRFLLGRKTD